MRINVYIDGLETMGSNVVIKTRLSEGEIVGKQDEI